MILRNKELDDEIAELEEKITGKPRPLTDREKALELKELEKKINEMSAVKQPTEAELAEQGRQEVIRLSREFVNSEI